jgi:hypothetical protein
MSCNVQWCNRPMHWQYVPRPFMPQVDEADETALVEWLAFRGIKVSETTIEAEQLEFHQHVDFNRVETMPADVYAKPIWVAQDGSVLDGNHRATAHKLKGDPVKALRVELPFEQAVAAIFSFAGTYDLAQHSARQERN